MPKIVAEELEISYGAGASRTRALRGINLVVEPQEFTLVVGPSGSGKTSLLTILGALVMPNSGRVLVDGTNLASISEKARLAFRRMHIGFVFQSFRLMTGLSAEENVRMSLSMRGIGKEKERAREALEAVGLARKANRRVHELSGGEKQRVALARALAHGPEIVLADEPTASLDSANGARIAGLLAKTLRHRDRNLVVVTHDDRLLKVADRVIHIEDGKIAGDALL